MDGVAIMAEEFRKEKAEREKAKAETLTKDDLKDALAQFTPPPAPKQDEPPKDDPKDDSPKDDPQDDDGK